MPNGGWPLANKHTAPLAVTLSFRARLGLRGVKMIGACMTPVAHRVHSGQTGDEVIPRIRRDFGVAANPPGLCRQATEN